MLSNQVSYVKLSDKPEKPATRGLQLVRTKARSGTIELLLPPHLAQQISSGEYGSILESLLTPADFIYTYGFRYPGVVEGILSNSACVGPAIEFAHANPAFAILMTILIASAAAYNAYSTYRDNEEARQKVQARYTQSHKTINTLLDNKAADEKKNSAQLSIPPDVMVAKLNAELAIILAEHQGSMKKMELIYDAQAKFKAGRIKVRCQFKDATDEPDEASLKPGWLRRTWDTFSNTLGLASYAYWILWIGAALFTGVLDFGIAGLPFWWLAFAIPAVMALPAVALKVYHWFQNGGNTVSDEYAGLKKAANNEMPDLLFKALQSYEYNRQMECLNQEKAALLKELGEHEQKRGPEDSARLDGRTAFPKVTVAATFVTVMNDEYGFAQYKAWYVTDLLIKAAVLAATAMPLGPVIGAPLFAIFLLYSGYKAYQQYKEIKSVEAQTPANNKQLVKVEELPGILSERLKALTQLKGEVSTLNSELSANVRLYNRLKNPNVAPEQSVALPRYLNQSIPVPSLKKPTVYDYFNRKMTGIFFARLFLTGAAITIPFAIVTLPFPPLTLALIGLSGLVYAGFKLFLDYQKNKKDYADKMLASITETQKQIDMAEAAKETLQLKQKHVDHLLQPVNKSDNIFDSVLSKSPSGPLFSDTLSRGSGLSSPRSHSPISSVGDSLGRRSPSDLLADSPEQGDQSRTPSPVNDEHNKRPKLVVNH